MVVAVAAAGAASCACFDDVVAVEPPSGLDLRLLLPSKMSPDELVVERLEPAVVLAVAGSFKLVPRLASLAGASRGAGAFFLSGASSAEPAVDVDGLFDADEACLAFAVVFAEEDVLDALAVADAALLLPPDTFPRASHLAFSSAYTFR